MMDTYITKQGDTWDIVALNVYGAEKYADYVMQNNYKLLNVFIFSAGTAVDVPELPPETTEDLPPWRQTGEETPEDEEDPFDM